MNSAVTQIQAVTNPGDLNQLQAFANAVRAAIGELQGQRGDSGGSISAQRLVDLGIAVREKNGSIAKPKLPTADEVSAQIQQALQAAGTGVVANGTFTAAGAATETIPTGIPVKGGDIPYAMPLDNAAGVHIVKVYFDTNDIKVTFFAPFTAGDMIRWAVFRP